MDPFIITEDEIYAARTSSPSPKMAHHAFDSFNQFGEVLMAHCLLSEERKWRYTTHSNKNNSGIQNHFQGLQRLRTKGNIAISGSNWRDECAEILIYELSSRQHEGAWLSNVASDKAPSEDDSFHYTIQLRSPPLRPDGTEPRDRILWHGGGMDTLKDILAIPIEHTPNPALKGVGGVTVPDDPNNSAIRFLNLSDIEEPRLFANGITRDDTRAGAVALTRLPSGYYLCGVWSDADPEPIPIRLDLYLSDEPHFNGRFRHGVAVKSVSKYLNSNFIEVDFTQKYQAVNFVLAEQGIYLIGFHVANKKHQADIFNLNIADAQSPPSRNSKGIGDCYLQFIKSIDFNCTKKYCNMRAASGSFVDDSGDIKIYSGAEWRRSNKIYFSEFRRPLPCPARVTLKTSFIEFYSKANLDGLTFTIRDLSNDNGKIKDFKNIFAREKSFGDKTWSIRFCLPKNVNYKLFKDHKFKKLLHTLHGTGNVEVISLVALGYEEELSSSQLA